MSLPKEFKEFGFIMSRGEMGKNEKIMRRLLWPVFKIGEGFLSVYVSVMILPFLFLFWLLNELTRRVIIAPLLRLKYGDKYRLVWDGADNIWSFKKGGNSRNILMMTVFENEIDVQKYQQNFVQRVLNYTDKNGKTPYKKLLKIFTQKFGYCCWKKDDRFDIKNHIKLLNMPDIISTNKDFVTESDLTLVLSECTQDMSNEYPQWEEIIIPRFVHDCDVQGGSGDTLKSDAKIKSAKILRLHHSYMEGFSIIIMLKFCMIDGPFDMSMDPLIPPKISFWDKIVQLVTFIFFGGSKMIANIFSEMNADSRFLTPKFTKKIVHAWSEPIQMEIIEKIQDKVKCSTTELFTCALGGALRAVSTKFCKKPQWLLFHDTLEESVLVGLAKFVTPYPNEWPINRFGVVGFDVNTASINSRLERLKLTRENYQKYVRGSPVPLLNHWLMKFVGRFPNFVIQKLMKDAGTPIVFSNLPHIKNKLILMGDLKVEEFFGWMPMLTHSGIGVATAKYCQKLRLCGVTETGCLSADELDYLLKAMRNEVLLMAEECL